MTCLTEKYRPRVLADVVGQPAAVKLLSRMPSLPGHAYWLAGPSGTGKTTLARILADSAADSYATTEIDGGDVSADWLRSVERSWRVRPLGNHGVWAYIVNEAHGLRSDAVRRLLTMLDPVPPHVLWVLTTTDDGQDKLFDGMDAHPLLSRCTVVPMARRDLAKAFAAHAQSIARAEGLDGQPIERYLKLAVRHKNSLRGMLGEIESGGMLEGGAE